MPSPAPGPRARRRDAVAAACSALLADFSLDITSNELGGLVPARAVIPAGTPVQLAFPDGADLAERVRTAAAIKEAGVRAGADHRGAPAPVAADAPGVPGRIAGGGRESADRLWWRGLAGEQQVFFLLGALIADDDVEPHAHCVPEPPQGLEVRHAAAQLDAR